MGRAETDKGARWERDVIGFLSRWWPMLERRKARGPGKDRGDLIGIPRTVIECKDQGQATLGTFMGQAERAMANANASRFVVVLKRRHHNVSKAYAIQPLDQWAEREHKAQLWDARGE